MRRCAADDAAQAGCAGGLVGEELRAGGRGHADLGGEDLVRGRVRGRARGRVKVRLKWGYNFGTIDEVLAAKITLTLTLSLTLTLTSTRSLLPRSP